MPIFGLGGGSVSTEEEFSNEVKMLQSMISNSFQSATNSCVSSQRVSQSVLNHNKGNNNRIDNTNISSTVQMVSYSECTQQGDVSQEILSDMKADLEQKISDVQEAMFGTIQKGIEALSDTAAIALGGDVKRKYKQMNSSDFKNLVQSSLTTAWVNETLATLTSTQNVQNINDGNNNEIINGAITQDVQSELVNLAASETSVMQELHAVQDVLLKQAAERKSEFWLSSLFSGYWAIIIGAVMVCCVLLFAMKMLKGSGGNNK